MCLEIIAIYGVGPRAIRLIWTYWGRLTMVARDGVNMETPSKDTMVWPKETPFYPQYSTWLCTPSSATGWRWRRWQRRAQRYLSCRHRTLKYTFTLTMDSSRQPNWRGCRLLLMSLQTSLNGSASGKIQIRWRAWHVSHATHLSGCWWWRMIHGRRGLLRHIGSIRGCGSNAWSAGYR